MTFLNLSLIAGISLAALPIVLHLMMRARPKPLEFPALRLLQQRHAASTRRLRLRHLLLLLLRMILVAVAALALARPSLPPARYGLLWYEWLSAVGIAAVTVAVYVVIRRRWRHSQKPAWQVRADTARLKAILLLSGLAAAAAAVGLPWGLRVRAEIRSPGTVMAENVPVAAVFVFDTSASMTYRHSGRTRLEDACQIAVDHLQVLPPGSRVAVTGSRYDSSVVFQADLAGTRSRIASLESTSRTATLNQMVRLAIAAQVNDRRRILAEAGQADGADRYVREICVFTDRAASAWHFPDDRGLHDLLLEHDWIRLYIVDVSVSDPVNTALTGLKLSESSVVRGQPLELTVDVSSVGASEHRPIVEVIFVSEDGQERRSTAPLPVDTAHGAATARFLIPPGPGRSVRQGLVRLSTEDPLPADDVRWFTLGVRPRPRILLVADSRSDARFLYYLLQPQDASGSFEQIYECTVTTTTNFGRHLLSSYDVVCLVGCRRPPDSLWTRLRSWVEDGGALLTFTGGRQRLDVDGGWSSVDCQKVLPGVLLRPVNLSPPAHFVFGTSHPITEAFRHDDQARTDLMVTPVYRCWLIEPADDARIVMSFSDERHLPALVERPVGSGRSLMLATACYNAPGRRPWNELPAAWSFLMLTDQMIRYLTGAADQRYNFVTGEPVEIQVTAGQPFAEYRILRPGLRQERRALAAGQRTIAIDDADEPGHYRILSHPDTTVFESGFAVNLPDEEADLTALTTDQLTGVLGKERFQIVRGLGELQAAADRGRLGVEVFPVLLGLLLLLFCSEYLMSAFFYDPQPVSADQSVALPQPVSADTLQAG